MSIDAIGMLRTHAPQQEEAGLPANRPCAILFGVASAAVQSTSRAPAAIPEAPVDLLRQMNAALRRTYETARDLLARANEDDVRSRYKVGTLIAELKKSEHKYGTHALPLLARALGTGVQTLYRCASVAERWTDPQVEALLQRSTQCGRPLSWSHFVVLSGVSSARRRAELVDRTISEGLSVRQLTQLLAARRPGVAVRGTLEGCLRSVDQCRAAAATMHAQLLRELSAMATVGTDTQCLLNAAIAAHEELYAGIEAQLEGLRAERRRLLPFARVSVKRSVG